MGENKVNGRIYDEKRYLKMIKKRLRCGRRKKKEIIKQIQSDLKIAVEEGFTMENAIKSMGTPLEVAGEFNENMSGADIKRAKLEQSVRGIIIVVVVVVLILGAGVYWMLPKSRELEDSGRFSTSVVKNQAEEVINYLDLDDYDSLRDIMTDQMKDEKIINSIRDAKMQISEDFGEFKSWGNSYMAEVTQMGKHYAVIDISVSYENTVVTYRLSFDEDMKLGGLYIR